MIKQGYFIRWEAIGTTSFKRIDTVILKLRGGTGLQQALASKLLPEERVRRRGISPHQREVSTKVKRLVPRVWPSRTIWGEECELLLRNREEGLDPVAFV
jgi:hypothetical protein